MSNELQTKIELTPEEKALLLNDLSSLNPEQRSSLYNKVCQSLGLNPLTQPFNYINLKGKLTLYAQRNCTDQLRSIQNVSVTIQSREKVNDLYIVTARATLPNGRQDESIGAVPLLKLAGEDLANAIMKCETKAKRRVTLSICGLSFMDETEVETIKDAKVVVDPPKPQHLPPPSDPHPNYEEEVLPFDQNPSEYEITFGNKYAGRKLKTIGHTELKGFMNSVKSWYDEQQRNLPPNIEEFMYFAKQYLSNG